MKFRDYQKQAADDIYNGWESGAKNMCAVLPTGAGKTVLFSGIARAHKGWSIAIAHRQELVQQMSLAYGRWEMPHQIIAPVNVYKAISRAHMGELGKCWIDPNAPALVGGVDTIRCRGHEPWMDRISLWIQDECHHVLKDNKWGKAIEKFPNAKGLGVTATPCRSDGKGLGAHADGVFDDMVVGPSMRDLIDRGSLCDYRIFAPPTNLDVSQVKVTASGDYSKRQLSEVVHEAKIYGGVVDHYLSIARGKRAVVFTVDVQEAASQAAEFTARGIPAAMVCGETPDSQRQEFIRRFRIGDLAVLCNCDLFGEGFDLPAIEVVIMARPTQSYGLFVQQFGRGLRTMDGKSQGIIIDHVGNCIRHGLPDAPREWSLDARGKRASKNPDEIPLRECPSCMGVYQRIRTACPYCSEPPAVADKTDIEQVDGDLVELDPTVLAKMRGEIARIDGPPPILSQHTRMVQLAAAKRHKERQEAQSALRKNIEWWLGYRKVEGLTLQETYRLFYHRHGRDVMSAHTLGAREAFELARAISLDIGHDHKKYVRSGI